MTTPPADGTPLVLVNTVFTKKDVPVADADLPAADPAKTWWTTRDLAAHFGLALQTIRIYRTQGKLPPPDETIARSPLWHPATIQAWKIPGKGQGYRSDLKDGNEH